MEEGTAVQNIYYEAHLHPEPGFPIIFRLDTARTDGEIGHLHWHEALEFLYCLEGEGVVVSDEEKIPFRPGELVVVDSNHIHTVYTEQGRCRYYCIIPSPSLFEGSGLPVGGRALSPRVTDQAARELFLAAVRELEGKAPYYKTAVRSLIGSLYVALYRNGVQADGAAPAPGKNGKPQVVKQILAYLQSHYTEEVSMEKICRETGFSKYYLCHAFKEVTGQTILRYVNFLRCCHARSLLAAGGCNVGESAAQSGFQNLSYFSRTYRRLMGELPSEQKGQSRLVR